MPLSQYEIAMQIASDHLAIDIARWKTELLLIMNKITRNKHSLRAAESATVALITDALNDINYRHQTYIAEQLNQLPGINITVTTDHDSALTIAGKTAQEWARDHFKAFNYVIMTADFNRGIEKLTRSLIMTLTVFASSIDVRNKNTVGMEIERALTWQ